MATYTGRREPYATSIRYVNEIAVPVPFLSFRLYTGDAHKRRDPDSSRKQEFIMEMILDLLIWLLQILTFALIGRALLSWVDPRGAWTISRLLADITEPIMAPLRRVIPPFGMLDVSFIVAIVLIQLLQNLLRHALYPY
jgi:YggT family protein